MNLVEGNWKFGLKDLAISSGKTGISTKYPLEGKDYFHANNCDTHNAYHQVTMSLEKNSDTCHGNNVAGNDQRSENVGKGESEENWR